VNEALRIVVVFLLVLGNAIFVAAEYALVTARRARLEERALQGGRAPRTALALMDRPVRFISTVQVGITVSGILLGAVGEPLVSSFFGDAVPRSVSFLIAFLTLTYLSVVLGELVPKAISLQKAEAMAVALAIPLDWLARLTHPLVWLLDRSGKILLRLLGQSGKRASSVSDEEIRLVIAEAEGAGVIEKGETEMIEAVMRIADRSARGLMTPRHEVEVADAGETRDEILARFRASGRSRLPLRDGSQDDIVGVLNIRDLLDAADADFDPKALIQPAPVIHEGLPAMQVIERLRAAPGHMLLVYDEYGHFEGIITAMDILGAIAGGFDQNAIDEPKIVEREDGSLLVAGWMPVDEFADRIGIALDDDPGYETVAGLVLHLAAELPVVGQEVTIAGWRLEVVDMDGRRIDKVLVSRAPPVRRVAHGSARQFRS
jgi:putative hemolysin